MLKLLQKLLKTIAYIAAALVIFLALAVGLFRLLLPRLPEYQEEIKQWANSAIGMQVEFSDMNARWRLSGPELTFTNAQLIANGADDSLLDVQEVSVGVNVMRLLSDRELVADRISLRDAVIDLRLLDDGTWLMQGIAIDDLIGSRLVDAKRASNVLLDLRRLRINLQISHIASEEFLLLVDTLQVDRNDRRTRIRAAVELPEEFGGLVNITLTQRTHEAEQDIWRIAADARAVNLANWSRFASDDYPEISSGFTDLSVSLERSSSDWQSAIIDFMVTDLRGPASDSFAPIAAQGHVEFAAESGGWVLSADRLMLRTVDGDWPETTVQLRPRFLSNGELTSLSASSSYVNFDDLRYLKSWLPEASELKFDELGLSGRVYELSFSANQLESDTPGYDVAAEFDKAGIARSAQWPGVRGFSGLIRANSAGGRLEIASTNMVVDYEAQLAEPIGIDDATGTIIWRANADGTIILSDNVRIRNAELDSQSSLQITVPADGGSPLVDLQSDWSINDISAVPRYLPAQLMSPGLYRWLSMALVRGTIPHGTTRFIGPLDKFPFDNGEGTFRIDAELVDATLRYSDKWPFAEILSMDVILDGARLYSVRNSAFNYGNSVVDAKIEIEDLRIPVLTIDAFATGTMESIRTLMLRSPIADVFGGHLSEVQVGGDASFDMQLRLPIRDREKYEFTTRIRASDGRLRFAGFAPELSELNGTVTVTRDEIVSESLFGKFLGEHVDLGLTRMDNSSKYSVIAEIDGVARVAALSEAFDIPLSGILNGAADYQANLLFPRAGSQQDMALQINVESQLRGIGFALPAPLAKDAGSEMPLSVTFEFPEAGRITTSGTLTDSLKWTLEFARIEERWDFDRGVMAVGGAYPGDPPTRGLHIVGRTDDLYVQQWLAVARQGDGGISMADRIRSIDLTVDNLYLLGQHLIDHRVVVQRSALDWFVQLSGEQNVGAITVPYDFAGNRPLIVDMEKLTLPGSDDASSELAMDPREFPPMQVRASEFSLGKRHFGSLTADLMRTADGLESSNLQTVQDSFSLSGSARWVMDSQDVAGQRSFLKATLKSSNVEETMRQLDYQPGVKSKDMDVEFDVSWSGGPRQDFFSSLDGIVAVKLGAGQLEEVEPGAGRVFGLMSVIALPRRLSLDFSDVFDRGFGFDQITGTFRLVDGEAYTCDLSLKGPAADVGIVGRASLVDREYDQAVIVSGNLGNTLPVVGGLMAGPQVAAALLIFSQIFKKPLQEMGQIYYGIEGSWDEPQINPADAERFAASGALADCIAGANR